MLRSQLSIDTQELVASGGTIDNTASAQAADVGDLRPPPSCRDDLMGLGRRSIPDDGACGLT